MRTIGQRQRQNEREVFLGEANGEKQVTAKEDSKSERKKKRERERKIKQRKKERQRDV